MPDPTAPCLILSPEEVNLARNKLAAPLIYLQFYGPPNLAADVAAVVNILNRGAGQLEDRPGRVAEGTSVFDLVLKPLSEDMSAGVRGHRIGLVKR
jgi:hypothetical protein